MYDRTLIYYRYENYLRKLQRSSQKTPSVPSARKLFVDTLTGETRRIVVTQKKDGCSTARRICIVCKTNAIHKNDRRYKTKICRECSSATLRDCSASSQSKVSDGDSGTIQTKQRNNEEAGKGGSSPLVAAYVPGSIGATPSQKLHIKGALRRRTLPAESQELLALALQRSGGYGFWYEFVISATEQAKRSGYLSPRQLDCLRKIARVSVVIKPRSAA